MTMLEHALDWARRGVPVVPCRPSGEAVKRPYIPRDKDADGVEISNTGGVKKASTDPDQIRAWWAQWPSAMIGGAMGRELRLLAIDPDAPEKPDDPDGRAAWDALVAEHGGIPPTHAQETPNGGRHYIFTMPEGLDLGNREGALKGKGINVRGFGGYLIMAPSRLADGRTYRMVDEFDFGRFAPAPQWLLDLIIDARVSEGLDFNKNNPFERHAQDSAARDAAIERYVSAAVDKECAEVAGCAKGGRNIRLNDAAFALGTLIGAGVLNRSEAERRLWDAAADCGHVRDEGRFSTLATIKSGLDGGQRKPRDLSKVRARERMDGGSTEASSDGSNRKAEGANESAAETPPSALVWYGDKPPEPPPMLVRDLLPQAQIGFIAGVYSAGKTFVAGDLAVCVMLATPFAGREIVRPGGVLWLAAEGANEIDARIKAAAAARSVDGEPASLPFARQAFDVPKLTTPEAEGQIVALAETFKAGLAERFSGTELVLIVIDTLGSATGFVDGNHSSEAQRVMDMLRRVNVRTGALVLVVDHFGKVVETGIMGASAKAQNAESILAILADKSADGTIGNRRMVHHKMRSGEGAGLTPFKLRQVQLTGFDGTSCVVDWEAVGQSVMPSAKVPKPLWSTSGERILKGCLERMLIDHGSEQQPFGRKGPKVKAVHLAKVRAEFGTTYPADEDDPKKADAAKRKALRRALDGAMTKNLVATKQIGASLVDWIWFVQDDVMAETDRVDR